MATQQRQEALRRSGRTDLAIQAFKRGQVTSRTAAAKAYDVSRKTLIRRLTGVQEKRGSPAVNRLLKPTEEAALVDWILSMDRRGMAPRQDTIREMARLLLHEHGQATLPGKN